MAQLHATRLQRLNAQEQAEWHAISTALRDPVAEDKDVLLVRLGVFASMADTYDPIGTVSETAAMIKPQGDIFHRVWTTCSGVAQEQQARGSFYQTIRRELA